MRGVILRFFQFDVQMDHPLIPWTLLGVWLMLVVAALSSVRNQEIGNPAKSAWLIVILAVPLVGLFAYALWCLIRADWTFFKPLLQSRSKAVRDVTRGDR